MTDEIENLKREIDRLQNAKRQALQVADERAKEANALRAATDQGIDKDDLDIALHEIGMMVKVAVDASGELVGRDDPEYFSIPLESGELLFFALYEVQRRVKELKDELCEAPKPKVIPIGGRGECA